MERAHQLLASNPRVLEVGLSGSLVRGDYGPGKDADLLVMLAADARWFVDCLPEYLRHFSGLGLAADVFPYTREDIAVMQDAGLVKSVLSERRVLACRGSTQDP
jgi:predicted nucleotidyltransferase